MVFYLDLDIPSPLYVLRSIGGVYSNYLNIIPLCVGNAAIFATLSEVASTKLQKLTIGPRVKDGSHHGYILIFVIALRRYGLVCLMTAAK